jgi:type IV secretion system protein TrbG
MRILPLTLVVYLLLGGGCQQGPAPEPPAVPPLEDLSQWTLPELVQPEAPKPLPEGVRPTPRPATPAEKAYKYAPGGVYKVSVALDAPLDVILEPGEQVQTLIGSDPKPIEPTQDQQQLKQRWEYKEGMDGVGERASAHIFLRAMEAGATLGLTITTTKRVYYLTCQSVQRSPIRALRWEYPPDPVENPAQVAKAPSLLPHPDEPKLYHVGYPMHTGHPAPAWMPRHVVDDGKKLYLIYPEVALFGTVPLVRAIGPNGPQVINARQFLNVVILDALAPKLELRVGTGERAEVVTITRGNVRTIHCPDDNECPRWPAAALRLTGR